MDQKKLRRKVDEQTARDHTFMRHWSERRYRRHERYTKEPVLPLFCRICFLCMIAATFLGLVSEAVTFFRSHARSVEKLLENLSATGLFVWLLFAVMLIPAALLQLRRGFGDPWFDRFQVPRKGKLPLSPEKVSRRYFLTAVIGLLVFLLFFLLTRLLP